MSPTRLAVGLAVAGLLCAGAGVVARLGEFAVVFGVFLILLAGGVLNWDRRSGH